MRLQSYGRRDFVEIVDKTLQKLGSKKGAPLVKMLLEIPDEEWKALTESAIDVVGERFFGERLPNAHTLALELRLREGLTREEFSTRISSPRDEISPVALHRIEYPSRKDKDRLPSTIVVEALCRRFKKSWEELSELIRSRPETA